jgi:hypothetical protein
MPKDIKIRITGKSASNWADYFKGMASLELVKVGLRAVVRGTRALAEETFELTKVAGSAEQINAKLTNALSNVKTASADGAKELINLATALQQTTTFGDEQIKNAQAMLATFQLNEKQIAQLTPRVLDMAASLSRATGETQSLEQISIALGKAMTGSTSLLTRYGVVIDEDAIKTDKFGGILKSLDMNFKGAAETLASTYLGKLESLGNIMADAQETIGFKLMPTFEKFVDVLSEVIPLISESFVSGLGDLDEVGVKLAGNLRVFMVEVMVPLAEVTGRFFNLLVNNTVLVNNTAEADLEGILKAGQALVSVFEHVGALILTIQDLIIGIGRSINAVFDLMPGEKIGDLFKSMAEPFQVLGMALESYGITFENWAEVYKENLAEIRGEISETLESIGHFNLTVWGLRAEGIGPAFRPIESPLTQIMPTGTFSRRGGMAREGRGFWNLDTEKEAKKIEEMIFYAASEGIARALVSGNVSSAIRILGSSIGDSIGEAIGNQVGTGIGGLAGGVIGGGLSGVIGGLFGMMTGTLIDAYRDSTESAEELARARERERQAAEELAKTIGDLTLNMERAIGQGDVSGAAGAAISLFAEQNFTRYSTRAPMDLIGAHYPAVGSGLRVGGAEIEGGLGYLRQYGTKVPELTQMFNEKDVIAQWVGFWDEFRNMTETEIQGLMSSTGASREDIISQIEYAQVAYDGYVDALEGVNTAINTYWYEMTEKPQMLANIQRAVDAENERYELFVKEAQAFEEAKNMRDAQIKSEYAALQRAAIESERYTAALDAQAAATRSEVASRYAGAIGIWDQAMKAIDQVSYLTQTGGSFTDLPGGSLNVLADIGGMSGEAGASVTNLMYGTRDIYKQRGTPGQAEIEALLPFIYEYIGQEGAAYGKGGDYKEFFEDQYEELGFELYQMLNPLESIEESTSQIVENTDPKNTIDTLLEMAEYLRRFQREQATTWQFGLIESILEGERFAGLLPRFKGGIENVPRTMLGILDQGERVLTAEENQGYSGQPQIALKVILGGKEIDARIESVSYKNMARRRG